MHLNPTLYSVFLTGAGAWVPASFVGNQDQHVCVNKRVSIHLNLCVAVCALVSKGWDRQWREQKVPVPEVRSACRHDAFPFSRPPAANTHSQNGLVAPYCPTSIPYRSCWYVCTACLPPKITLVLWSGLSMCNPRGMIKSRSSMLIIWSDCSLWITDILFQRSLC